MHMMLQSIDIINAMCIALTNGYIEKSHELWEKSTGNENDYIIADYEVINDMASAMKFKLMISDCDIDELSVWYTFKIFIRLLMLRLLYQNNNKTILIGKETASLIRMVSSVIRNWEMKHSVNLITGSHERYVYRPEEIQKSLKENTEKMFNFLVNTASLESGNVRYADNILYYTDKYLDELNELKISLDKFDSDLTKARLEKIEGIDIQPKNVKFLKKGKLDETRKI
jgi:hypothetical protein